MSAGLVADSLAIVGVPEVLLMEVPGERARVPGDGVRHPIAGWDLAPISGEVRVWAAINVLYWFDTAARHGLTVFGPYGRGQIAALEFGARAARAGGAGVQTLWGLDVHTDEGWVRVNDLVAYGPPLPDEVVVEVSGELVDGCAGHAVVDGPNRHPAEVSYTMTTWAAGIV